LVVQIPPPTLWNELVWRLSPASRRRLACPGFPGVEANVPPGVQTFLGDSYPRNHTYSLLADSLVPSRKLATRVAGLSRHFPEPLTSLLDLSCSKGFFVFHAAAKETCRRALGIDLSDECLKACRQLNTGFIHRERVRFEKLTLAGLAGRIEEFGGPFQTVLLVNTYQYLFFGSTVAPPIAQDHRHIFCLLRRVCSGRLVFHNRLSLADVQSDPRERAAITGTGARYNPEAIRDAATEFFRLTALRRWLGYPVWLLDAK